jgi:hypothetical protein
MGTSLH